MMGRAVKEAALLTADSDGIACAKLLVFANAVEDNPFMAARFTAWASRSRHQCRRDGPGVCITRFCRAGTAFDV
jgi:uncharacterized protein (UPF0210 family)